METKTIESFETENKKKELKHLEFVKIAAINALICVSNLYEYAKQNSGPLRSGVQTVEGTVTTVVGPVYEKFKDVPHHLLVFFDKKVDEATTKFDEHAPPLAKQAASQTWCMVQKASQLTQSLLYETRTKGVPVAARDTVNKSERYMSEQAVKAWSMVNKVPAFQMGAEMAVPTAAHWSDKYNQVVTSMRQKGYTVFSYLPLVPLDKIAKAFERGEAGKDGEPISDGGVAAAQ